MEYKIDTEILRETVKCRKNFSCLSGVKDCLCEVEDNIYNKILFIKPRSNKLCDYRNAFGYSYVCNCPTRKEIFRLYSV